MIGTMISHYRILHTLGQGGMGVVYEAEDTRLKRKVALKFLPEQITGQAEFRQRFEQEAQAASSLNHPNIATVYDIDEADGRIFIAMEYIDGMTLREWIREKENNRDSRHRPVTNEVSDLAIQIADALAAAHERGIVHRDVKPENIMVTRDGRAKPGGRSNHSNGSYQC